MEADGYPKPGEQIHAEEEKDVAPVQGLTPNLPGRKAERDERDHRDQACDDPVAGLVGNRLDV